ncbi:dihydroflavonol-4-reductase [Lophium mytilinum]|uniref:Dihydroflavonol-4-reductase n=1 Tax=Lophium mytilinum TaxID=390894 RepID=A0A6A6R8H1_9PEZI|nr:dihydroflavonol-4-reductase [Lophium mytilinum]
MASQTLYQGSLILVTGVNGMIGSHIADQLLARGYHVRGAVRDVQKSAWLTEFFGQRHRGAQLSLVAVPDITVEGCYDEAVKNVSGFIHTASPLSGSTPEDTIPIASAGALNALKAAAKELGLQRVVFTSSSIAATMARPGVEFSIDATSFNEEAIAKAWKFPADEPPEMHGLYIYGGSKAQAEKDVWEWLRENKPHYAFNSVLPNCNIGKVLRPDKQGFPSIANWVRVLLFDPETLKGYEKVMQPQWYIDPVDDALIHIAALIYADVTDERLFAFAEPFTWNQVLAIARKQFPDRTFPEDIEGQEPDLCKVPNQRALELLKRMGVEGWTGLEESVKELGEQLVDFGN